MVPRQGGVEFAARARQHLPALRVLFVSGHPFERVKLPQLDPTRELYLAKPFTPAQLRHEAYRALSLASGSDASRTA